MSATASAQLSGRPERVFVSVDGRLGRSTVSFAPPEVGEPICFENDPDGARGVEEARAIAGRHPGCTVEGPHFHTSDPNRRPRRRPPPRR